jgi:hypothetical protein
VLLEKENLKPNPCLRLISKLNLNTLWGYFAMNTNKPTFRIIYSLHEWIALLNNDRYTILSDVCIDGRIHVTYIEKEEFHSGNGKTNEILAAFVTCHARLKLLEELEKIGDRVMYFGNNFAVKIYFFMCFFY